MKARYLLSAAVLAAAICGRADATTMTFSGLSAGAVTLPGGYKESGITAANDFNFFWGYPNGGILHFDPGTTHSWHDFTYGNNEEFGLARIDLDLTDVAKFALEGYDADGSLVYNYSYHFLDLDQKKRFLFDVDGLSRLRVSLVNDRHFSVDNISFRINGAVPEPATWAMLILGFGATGIAVRRRRPRCAAPTPPK